MILRVFGLVRVLKKIESMMLSEALFNAETQRREHTFTHIFFLQSQWCTQLRSSNGARHSNAVHRSLQLISNKDKMSANSKRGKNLNRSFYLYGGYDARHWDDVLQLLLRSL